MEKAGAADMDDEVERKGLGTPATRADIIEKLVKDGFVKRDKKQMIPTEDGMKLITVLPDVVKSPQLTADWENALVQVSRGEYSMEEFMDGIEQMVSDLVAKYEGIGESTMDNPFSSGQESLGACPKCKAAVVKGKYGPYCSGKCGMIFGRAMGATLTEKEVKSLLEGKKILVKNLRAKSGKTYDAYLEPNGIEEFSYTDKNGKEHKGSQYKFNMSFPKKKN
jgi:DNA topoisomerase-3